MLVSPAVVEYSKEINLPYCEVCFQRHPKGKHVTLDEIEQNYIIKIFVETGRNVIQTAKILQISRSTLHRKLDRYGERSRAVAK